MPHQARYASIDLMRALSMLYIVGFWHLLSYVPVITWNHNPITARLILLVLGLFTLISGYLVGEQEGEITWSWAWRFYKKRFWRIYVPFVVAVGLFLITGIGDAATFARGMTPLAMFLAPTPMTLWFIGMMLFCYLLAPALMRLRKDTTIYIIVATLITMTMLLYQKIIGAMDTRLILYFPSFAAGILLAGHPAWLQSPKLRWGLFLSAIVALLLTLLRHSNSGLEFNVMGAPWVLCSSMAVFVFAMHAGQNLKPMPIIMRLSEASFYMYLLHRPIYSWAQKIWFPDNAYAQALYLLCVCLPVIAIIAWFTQDAYVKCMRRYKF